MEQGLQGQLPAGTTYEEVCRVFGKPQEYDPYTQDKIKARWMGTMNNLAFTIYDYKSEYCPEQTTDWHIGGHTDIVAVLLGAYFARARYKGMTAGNRIY
jgi:hypothetical protein